MYWLLTWSLVRCCFWLNSYIHRQTTISGDGEIIISVDIYQNIISNVKGLKPVQLCLSQICVMYSYLISQIKYYQCLYSLSCSCLICSCLSCTHSNCAHLSCNCSSCIAWCVRAYIRIPIQSHNGTFFMGLSGFLYGTKKWHDLSHTYNYKFDNGRKKSHNQI